MQHESSEHRRGLIYAFLAYATWGLFPIYFRLVGSVGPIEVLSHRVVWSCVFILIFLCARREFRAFVETMRDGRILAALTTSGILIALNWLVYIWAVLHNHIVAASLAYFLNPLVNVLIGVVLLGERLRVVQWCAIGLAAAGVVVLGAGAPQTLGISLFLALTFAIYGLVRKLTPVSPLTGLGIETLALLPPALTGLAWTAGHGGLGFGQDVGVSALLVGGGLITSVPLIMFAVAARLLPMVTLGLIQYVTPTMLFLCGVLLYGEHLSTAQWASFALIWTGLVIFAGHTLRAGRSAPAGVAAVEDRGKA
ncbi:EamA family transporter RarD [Sphingobium sufflavum]|uniref:EamA family transporter RarD n=1 Tax=Sphingobium sufflavum TaxID=1129547 RepID=UPI001F3108C9|nr:EamA family transporter RarD [Sphingobium sufflavum]MCE7798611.1 EamA family transporter RarD [Sphingobium sufflavum]